MEIILFNKKLQIPKAAIYTAIPVLVLCLSTVGYRISRGNNTIIVSKTGAVATEQPKQIDGTKEETVDAATVGLQHKTEEEIKIYVTGCVKNEGIVVLKKGQLIDDAIKAAGGVTDQADLRNINLVYKLTGNVMLRIKPKGEPAAAETVQIASSRQADGGGDAGVGVDIVKDDGDSIVNAPSASSGKPGGKVNINLAGEEQLDTLPGIGASTARDIVLYREKNGQFKSVDEIMKVPGIKESRFSKIKDLIAIE